MTVSTAYIELDTKGKTDIVDITSRVDSILKKENISCGTVTVFCYRVNGCGYNDRI